MKTTTRKALLAALKRLVASKPNNRALKIKVQNGKLKINKSNVEKEAGLSVGVLRNHPDIVELINKKSLELRVNNSDSATSTVHLLEEENAYLKNEKASLIRKKKEYLDRSKKHEEALAVQAANHIKIVQELMEMIPESEREKAMDSIITTRPDNVVRGKFK